MKYKGVKILRVKEMICGSDCKELKNGTLRNCKPKYDIYYQYPNGALHDTRDEVKESIDTVMQQCIEHDCYEKKMFIEIMNKEG